MPCEGTLHRLRPVTLKDRPVFDRYLKKYPQQISELTFTNIFCWAEVKHHLWCEQDSHLLVSYRKQDCALKFLPPVGPSPERIIQTSLPGLSHYAWTRLPEGLANRLTRDRRPVFDRDNSDYVYALADLRELAGKRYDGKRNFIKRFQQYAPVIKPLTKSMTADCLRVQEAWLATQRNNPSAVEESTALMKALQHFDALSMMGVAVFVQGSLAGFAVGEPLSSTMFVEHFEKALPEYKGVYPYLLHAFARHIPPSFTELNREQDLGLPGLRKAKESWQPQRMIGKCSVKNAGASSRACLSGRQA